MYSVTVRDHVMIAHSLKGQVFGPAQRLHGATYVVDVEFKRPGLGSDGIVVDIGRAGETLHRVLAELKSLHRDVHDLQDAVEELYQALVPGEEEGPQMRSPTIIEDVPSASDRSRPGL